MKTIKLDPDQNIWQWHDAGDWVVVPIRYGPCVGAETFAGVTGRTAYERFPQLLPKYHKFCAILDDYTRIIFSSLTRTILLPVKPTRQHEKAVLKQRITSDRMIEYVADNLETLLPKAEERYDNEMLVAVPEFGGNDWISKEKVEAILSKRLKYKSFLFLKEHC